MEKFEKSMRTSCARVLDVLLQEYCEMTIMFDIFYAWYANVKLVSMSDTFKSSPATINNYVDEPLRHIMPNSIADPAFAIYSYLEMKA